MTRLPGASPGMSLLPRVRSAAHIPDMPAALTISSATELAATLAHTSALLGEDDAGYPAFSILTRHLTEPDRRHHWSRLLEASSRQFALGNPRTGAAAVLKLLDNAMTVSESAKDLLDVDPERYMSVNRADRPGENDYDGYDIVSLAIDLAAAWDAELVRRARTALEPGSRPRSVLADC